MPSLHIIYASTSGHTEFVVDALIKSVSPIRGPACHGEVALGPTNPSRGVPQGDTSIIKQRAEQAQPEDLLKGDVLILASGTWNTGGAEGQLNPHMHMLLRERAKEIDLKGKKVAVIGLGDNRYHFTCRAADHLEEFVRTHNGILIEPTLRIINEPYGQEEKIRSWGLLVTGFSFA